MTRNSNQQPAAKKQINGHIENINMFFVVLDTNSRLNLPWMSRRRIGMKLSWKGNEKTDPSESSLFEKTKRIHWSP